MGKITKKIILLFLLTGCAGALKETDPKIYYKRDVYIESSGKGYRGVAVLPERSSYHIDLESPGKMDLITISSCHREISKEDVGYKHGFDYVPAAGLERVEACPLQINGYEKNRGRHTFGYIAFENSNLTLPALVKCNGNETVANGVSVCQSREGLIQKIIFLSRVRVASKEGCEFDDTKDAMDFTFSIKPRECQYVFKELEGEKRVHVLDTIGYEQILLREN